MALGEEAHSYLKQKARRDSNGIVRRQHCRDFSERERTGLGSTSMVSDSAWPQLPFDVDFGKLFLTEESKSTK